MVLWGLVSCKGWWSADYLPVQVMGTAMTGDEHATEAEAQVRRKPEDDAGQVLPADTRWT